MNADENNPIRELGEDFQDLLDQPPGSLWKSLAAVAPSQTFIELARSHFLGPEPPRICLLIDETGRPAFRAAAAVSLARALLARGLRVAILDGDELQPDLSLWAGRLDREGWVDVLRYGVSLESASALLGSGTQAVRVLGVGSYHPVRMEEGEYAGLLERLSADVDVLVVSLPVGPAASGWLALDGIRLLCWDRREQTPERVETTLRRLAELGVEPEQVLACGTPLRPANHDNGVAGSSPVFRRLAFWLSLLVVVVAVWWFAVVRDKPARPLTDETEQAAERDAGAAAVTTRPVAPLQDAGFERSAAAMDTTAPSIEMPPADTVAEPLPGEIPDEERIVVDDDTVEQVLPPPVAVREPDQFSVPPGPDGWSLHVYSFRDRALARVELATMARAGVVGVVNEERDDEGRTVFRIYAGRFPSRRQAREALPELLDRLSTDWAMPVRASRLR